MAHTGGVLVTVGVHEDVGRLPHAGGPETIADVAQFVEYGTEKTPARSFLRATIESEQRQTERALADAAERVAKYDVPPEKAYLKVGQDLALKIRARTPSETGDLARAIEARVTKPGEREGGSDGGGEGGS